MNLKVLAKAANVSVSTASKALKRSKELSSETINHVLRVAEDIGYFIEKKKQSKSATKKCGKIIIVVPEIVSVYYSSLATELTYMLRGIGFEVRVYLYNFNAEYRSEIFYESLYDEEVTGIIAIDCSVDFADFGDFPVVSVGARLSTTSNDNVMIAEIVEYLTKLGHKKICYFGEKLTYSREKSFLSATNKLRLDKEECKVFISNSRFEKAGYELVKNLLKTDYKPTAIVAAYDEIAFGAISALMENGYKIPEDISVVGINNVPGAEFYPVPLTTVGIVSNEYCEKIARTLENIVMDNQSNAEIALERKLFIRKSTAKVK